MIYNKLYTIDEETFSELNSENSSFIENNKFPENKKNIFIEFIISIIRIPYNIISNCIKSDEDLFY